MYRTERLNQAVVVIAVFGAAGVSHAATASEFYLNLLHRGVIEFDAGRFESAASQLRIAAFGLMDAVEHYQTAQVYLAISSDRTADADGARSAARRVVSAEKIRKTYGSLALPSGIRTTFDALAKTLLTPAEVSILATSPKTAPARVEAAQPRIPPAAPAVKPPAAQTPAPAKPPAVQTTTPAKSTPPPQTQTPPREMPKQEPPRAEPQREATKQPEPARVEPQRETTAPPPHVDPPKPVQTAPAPPPPRAEPPKPAPVTRDLSASFNNAERTLNAANLVEARRIYRELLEGQLTHEQALRVAEGLYRARDFAFALRAFERVGALRKGEEPYRYYLAVALYETGKYAAAKNELAAVLPYIEITPDVTRYRAKIESAID